MIVTSASISMSSDQAEIRVQCPTVSHRCTHTKTQTLRSNSLMFQLILQVSSAASDSVKSLDNLGHCVSACRPFDFSQYLWLAGELDILVLDSSFLQFAFGEFAVFASDRTDHSYAWPCRSSCHIVRSVFQTTCRARMLALQIYISQLHCAASRSILCCRRHEFCL